MPAGGSQIQCNSQFLLCRVHKLCRGFGVRAVGCRIKLLQGQEGNVKSEASKVLFFDTTL